MQKQILTATILASAIGFASQGYAATEIAENTTVSGKAFVDFTSIDQDSNGVKSDASGVGIDVKRFYIGVDHVFDSMWSANITTDFNYANKTTETQETQVFIKKAFVRAKISDELVINAGAYDTPWIPYAESLYGYRWIEPTLIDHVKVQSSADWGINASGLLSDGMVNYSVSVINGNGYKNPTRTNTMDLEARVGFTPVKGLTFAAGYYNGKLGQDKESTDPQNTASRYNLLAAYIQPSFRIGAEYYKAKNWGTDLAGTNLVLSKVATDSGDGYSVWGSVNFTEKLAAFARYDEATTSEDLLPNRENKYFNIGLAYKARKNVDLGFVVKNDKTTNGAIGTSNGTIGGTSTAGEGKFKEFGLFAQISY